MLAPSLISPCLLVLLGGAKLGHAAIDIDVTNAASVKSAASAVAANLMHYYTGNNPGDVPGNLPAPYYWWEAGGMFGHMVDYWYYTGDTTYNDRTQQAITFQAGADGSFMPANQTKAEGNDDQTFWAYAALEAAEYNFPQPSDPKIPSYISMAQAVFNQQAERWDTTTCGGGLRWQIFSFNNGYDYKNVPANGGLFMVTARLARYTGNDTYVQWAEKTWDWFSSSLLYEAGAHKVNDGIHIPPNCTSVDPTPWTYNYGFYLLGLAFIYNHTEDAKWLPPLQGMLATCLSTFAPENNILQEITCEPSGRCDTDNYSFKSYLSRWLATVGQLVPSVAAQIQPVLAASAVGAAKQCDSNSHACGFSWIASSTDGSFGVGQQMCALSVIQSTMLTNHLANLPSPYTAKTGGTSKQNGAAGTGVQNGNTPAPAVYTETITTGMKAGAGILTAMCLVLTVGGAAWLLHS